MSNKTEYRGCIVAYAELMSHEIAHTVELNGKKAWLENGQLVVHDRFMGEHFKPALWGFVHYSKCGILEVNDDFHQVRTDMAVGRGSLPELYPNLEHGLPI